MRFESAVDRTPLRDGLVRLEKNRHATQEDGIERWIVGGGDELRCELAELARGGLRPCHSAGLGDESLLGEARKLELNCAQELLVNSHALELNKVRVGPWEMRNAEVGIRYDGTGGSDGRKACEITACVGIRSRRCCGTMYLQASGREAQTRARIGIASVDSPRMRQRQKPTAAHAVVQRALVSLVPSCGTAILGSG